MQRLIRTQQMKPDAINNTWIHGHAPACNRGDAHSVNAANPTTPFSETDTHTAAIFLVSYTLQVLFYNHVNIFRDTTPLFVVDKTSTLKFANSNIKSAISHGIRKTLDGNNNWRLQLHPNNNREPSFQFSLHPADHRANTQQPPGEEHSINTLSAEHPYIVLVASRLDRSKERLVEIAATQWGLTTTEKAVLFLIIDGLSNKEIAQRRQVSPETVKRQAVSILSKSKCDNRTMLASQVFHYLELQLAGKKKPSR